MAVKRQWVAMEDEQRKRARSEMVHTGKRTREEEAEDEMSAAYKRLAISPRVREKAASSTYTEVNNCLRECHILREQRRHAADAQRHQYHMAAAAQEEQQRLRDQRLEMQRQIEAKILAQQRAQDMD